MIDYARPGTHKAEHPFRGLAVTSTIVSLLSTIFPICLLCIGFCTLSRSSAGTAADHGLALYLVVLPAVMLLSAATLFAAGLKLLRLDPLGIRLHRIYATIKLFAIIMFFIALIGDFPEERRAWPAFLIVALLGSLYPFVVLRFLRGVTENDL
jgi:hypothetical protein